MESYIEISFLMNMATMVLALCLASYSIIQPMSLKQMSLYACIQAFVSCFTFFPYAYVITFGIELLFFIAFFQKRKKLFVFAYAIRWFLYMSCFAWFGGGFHNGMYFLPIRSPVYIIAIIYALFFLLLKRNWSVLLAKSSYIYEVKVILPKKTLRLKGYLDSGNLLKHKQLPVVFLDQKYQTYFKDRSIEYIVMNTVHQQSVLHACLCDVKISGCNIHMAYICCEQQLHLPFDADLLLNINLMTMG